jgi:hypothetical protein
LGELAWTHERTARAHSYSPREVTLVAANERYFVGLRTA